MNEFTLMDTILGGVECRLNAANSQLARRLMEYHNRWRAS
jgi:hypothetical protein